MRDVEDLSKEGSEPLSTGQPLLKITPRLKTFPLTFPCRTRNLSAYIGQYSVLAELTYSAGLEIPVQHYPEAGEGD